MSDISRKLFEIIRYCNDKKEILQKDFDWCVMNEEDCKKELNDLNKAESICKLFSGYFLSLSDNINK